MPFDNRPPAYDVNDLIAWLETKDRAQTYPYYNSKKCLISQWLTERTGLATKVKWGLSFTYTNGVEQYKMSKIEFAVARPKPHTIGDALDRARAMAPS